MYGIDIATSRIDEQDRQIIQHASTDQWKIKKALILGSGKGRIGVFLALLGFEVTCIDIDDYSEYYSQVNKACELQKQFDLLSMI